ncbi:diacylglycerol kinase family protein [Actinomycetospora lutea]|uniref:diacylglycerol/lipid kinase family protein n=1 Tax=Actinomycetospora lutea TaxID=663604 RepID=UPI0023665649|nr:diacylglycerol kinase family protein [Actinomycetospora lutea]MDD7941625.1 diacylglycerol kinase family protein [Actinomycetospora lutea]
MAALGAGLAALAVVVAGLLREPLKLPLAVAAVAVAVVAGWDALVHRGARRYASGAVVVMALAGSVLVLDLHALARLATVVALVLISLAAARVALSDARDTAAATTRSVGAAARGALLMNPRSGGGRVIRFDLENQARRRGITPILLEPGDDLRALAERAVADGADVLGMAGGDGSQALVADVARRHGLPMVCVPAGTRNHFALDLGLDRDDVVGALDAFGEAVERRVDLAGVGDRVFVNNASLGVYATVVQSDAYRAAKIRTTSQMLPDLLGPDARGFDLRFDPPDQDRPIRADLVLVSNNVYRVERLSGFGTRARLDEGVLGVVTLTLDTTATVSGLLAAELRGDLHRHPGFRQWSTPEFTVDSGDELIDVGVDGEALQLAPPLHFRSLPAALRVRVPKDRPAVARPPLPRPGEASVELLRRAAGRPPRRTQAL